MEWRHSGSVSPTKKKIWLKNPLENFLPRYFGNKTTFSWLIIFQRAKLSTRSVRHLCWCKWRIFWRNNASGSSPIGFVLARQCPGSPGTCNSEEIGLPWLPVSWLPTLLSRPGLVGLLAVPWTEKTIEMSPFFVRCGGHFCRGILVGRTNF